MTKAERARLLRRLHPAPAIEPVGKRHRERRPDYVNPGLNWRGRYGIQLVFQAKEWISVPDAVPAKPALRISRKARKSALTRIAEQLPAKLPRVLFDP